MSDLTDHVADALFQHDAVVKTATGSYGLAMSDCDQLAAVALQAARAQGWRIVKLAPAPTPDTPNTSVVADEWTG